MAALGSDPYKILGVARGATDAELRAAYRRLVQLHHPDHNAGSAESARKFEEVQDAYARVRALRARTAAGGTGPGARGRGGGSGAGQAAGGDPDLESRLADMERELREARAAQEEAASVAAERAREAARHAAAEAADARSTAAGLTGRASDEDLGYIRTDDSFSKIISDVRSELSDRLSDAREHPAAKRVSDLIDELDDFVSRTVRNPKR